MTDNKAKEAFKKTLEQAALQPDQLDQLMAMQTRAAQKEEKNTAEKTAWTRLSSAVSLLMMLGLGFWLGGYQQPTPVEDIPSLIAYEVASQHLKNKPMDMQTQSFDQLANYFTELDFKPFASNRWQGDLIGGRYCSLRTVPSAQIRYYDKQGVMQTLYQAEYLVTYFAGLPDVTKGEAPLVSSAKGLDVVMWREKGIVFATTRDR